MATMLLRDPFALALELLPYSALRPPKLRLKLLPSSIALPSPMLVLAIALASYFMVVSGFVYDVIVEPPGIGSRQDPHTGAVRPVVFLPGRINGQYIIEGLSSAFFFLLGGLGFILLDLSISPASSSSSDGSNRPQHVHDHRPPKLRLAFLAASASLVALSYFMSILFVRIKIPGYLR